MDDHSLFRKTVGQVRHLRQDHITPYRKARKPIPEQSLRDEQAVLDDLLSDAEPFPELETGEELIFARPGLQHNVLRRLRRGQFLVQAELDLHGCTVAEAEQLTAGFLHQARKRRWRCVRIVHGKGRCSVGQLPVLKGKVNAWLRRRDEVLAFCSARPVDGGTGAVYVLLKKG